MQSLLARAALSYLFALSALFAMALFAAPSAAQAVPNPWEATEGNVVVPQVHSFLMNPNAGRLHVSSVEVDVAIARQVATTAMDIHLVNPGSRVEEATLLVPVPEGASVRGFDFEGAAVEPTATLLLADDAKNAYSSIVSRSKDPALLEFAGYSMLRSSVFPVPAHGEQRVRLVYEHILPVDGERADYVLPRSESLADAWVPWKIHVRIASDQPITTLYSPTHEIEEDRISPTELDLVLDGDAARQPGPFQLSYLLEGAGVSASFFAYPDARVGGGYFLMLAGVPVTPPPDAEQRRREVIFVLDRSGSMAGSKLEQAKKAVDQVLRGLRDGETFNIVDYSSSINSLAAEPVVKSEATLADARAYLSRLDAAGGTALDAALREALRMKHDPETLPLVLFLTDGLPTVGEKSEVSIRKHAEELNEHARRIFTFGVGNDVNAPLLDRIADVSRATSEYVQPEEDVEIAVSRVFKRLKGPVLAAPELTVRDRAGKEVTDVVRDRSPRMLPDLYEGDQLVILGKYTREDALFLHLKGDWFGKDEEFAFQLKTEHASVKNAFVPRLWASRRIGELIDDVRQDGAGEQSTASLLADPAHKEVMEEILRLSTDFGVLTEYTSFLALEGTELGKPGEVLAKLDFNLRSRARAVRVGRAAQSQSTNIARQRIRAHLNRTNEFLDSNFNRVRNTRVIQVGDRTYFRRDNLWVDARVVRQQKWLNPLEVAPDSADYVRISRKLVASGRQAVFALRGDVLTEIDGEVVRLKGRSIAKAAPQPAAAEAVPALLTEPPAEPEEA